MAIYFPKNESISLMHCMVNDILEHKIPCRSQLTLIYEANSINIDSILSGNVDFMWQNKIY